MRYPKHSDLVLFRLNNGNTIFGVYAGSDDTYFEVINPALIVETNDAVNGGTNIDIIPAIQKHYIDDNTSLDGISWLLDKSIVVVLSNETFKINEKILTAYNNIFNPVEANADSNTRI
jgi:hypothetical protein